MRTLESLMPVSSEKLKWSYTHHADVFKLLDAFNQPSTGGVHMASE